MGKFRKAVYRALAATVDHSRSARQIWPPMAFVTSDSPNIVASNARASEVLGVDVWWFMRLDVSC